MSESLRKPTRTAGSPGSLLVRAQLAAGMIIFGSATPVAKIVTTDMPVFIASAIRVAAGAALLAPFAWRYRAAMRSLTRSDWLLLVGIAVFGMFGFSVFMLYGMRLTSAVAGAIMMATTPAVTATGAVLFLGEQANARRIGAVVLALAGAILLHLGGGPGGGGTDPLRAVAGSGLVFAAVCCEAAYTLIGRKVSQGVPPILIAFLAAILSLPLFLPLAMWQSPAFDIHAVEMHTWLAVLWYGAGTFALGSWLWFNGVARTRGSVAAAYMGLMPLSALVLSYVLLREPFRWIHAAGFAIVVSGVVLISVEHARMADE